MKKPTVEEWMAYHTEMHILAKAAHNPYVFDPKTKVQFATPKSLRVALEHITNLDLLNDTKENDMNDLTRDDLWNLLRLAEDYAICCEEGEEEHDAYTTLATKIYAVIRKMEETK